LPLFPTILSVSIANPHYIRFPMEDGGKCVTVHIATNWLKYLAERDQRSTNNLLLLYNFYRGEIEAAASAKYDQAHCTGSDVVIVAADLE
jgi:Protein of unknown function (DUF1488)